MATHVVAQMVARNKFQTCGNPTGRPTGRPGTGCHSMWSTMCCTKIARETLGDLCGRVRIV
eukprot:2360988-Pyramimonas_sp.AAC.1